MTIPAKIQDVYKNATCIYTTEQINVALDQMAKEIHDVLAETNPVLLCVMVGGLVLMGNLLPRLDFPLEVDYIHATRYRSTTSGGEVHWKVKPNISLKNRNVLVIDDILDGGVTLAAILDFVRQEGATSVRSAVLVDKQHKRVENGLENADFVGLVVEDHWIFGYGMDYHEYLRNAPGIYMVNDL